MRNNAESDNRIELMQGTLDMLILRTLVLGPAHGHEIAKHIQRTTDDVLQVEHGSLYPALHRLERKGWVTGKWQMPKDRKREFKYYRLTPTGRKQLAAERSKWRLLVGSLGGGVGPGGGGWKEAPTQRRNLASVAPAARPRGGALARGGPTPRFWRRK